MHSFSVLRASMRRALALLLGCVLAVSWVGSARGMCAMTPGHAMDASAGHAMEHGMMMTAVAGASTSTMHAAMLRPASAAHPRGASPGDERCPMHARGDSPCTPPAASQTRHTGLQGDGSARASHHAPANGSSSGTMPDDCAAAAHCAAVTAAAFTPTVAPDPVATRDTRTSADGPLLGASESAVEPTAPPPRG